MLQEALTGIVGHAQSKVGTIYVQTQGCSEVTWHNTSDPLPETPQTHCTFDSELVFGHCTFKNLQLLPIFFMTPHPFTQFPDGVVKRGLRRWVLNEKRPLRGSSCPNNQHYQIISQQHRMDEGVSEHRVTSTANSNDSITWQMHTFLHFQALWLMWLWFNFTAAQHRLPQPQTLYPTAPMNSQPPPPIHSSVHYTEPYPDLGWDTDSCPTLNIYTSTAMSTFVEIYTVMWHIYFHRSILWKNAYENIGISFVRVKQKQRDESLIHDLSLQDK